MRKGLFTGLALALMLIVPSTMLLAQEKPAPPVPPPPPAKEMKISQEQKAKMEAFRLDQKMKTIDARAELQKQAIMLKKELMKDQPSMADVEAILKRMSDARTKMQMIRIAGMLEMRKMYGPDWKMHMEECCPGMGPGAMGEEAEGCEWTEGDAPKMMAPFGGCRGERGPMERARKVIKIHKDGGEGGCKMQGAMSGMMMEKKDAGCGMGPMGASGDKRVVIMKGGAGGCMKEKAAGCAMGRGEGRCMKKMRAPRAMGAGMAGVCAMRTGGAAASCASMDEGWQHRHLYRPHFGKGCCSSEMKAICGTESSCKQGGAHKCSGACAKKIKVKVENE